MSDAVTRGVRVQVESFYVPERSDPQEDLYFFAYRVRITNEGSVTVQLISRRWVITDFNGQVKQVEGLGVVNEQPVLTPGESFEYTSFCPLPTPFGSMEGAYVMAANDGESFEAEIAPFGLSIPSAVH